MTKVRMTAPLGVESISIEGVQISVVSGVAMVDTAHVSVAQSHGFELPYSPSLDVPRPNLVQTVAASFRRVAETFSDEVLRGFLASSDEQKVDIWEKFRESITALTKPAETKPAETKPAETTKK